MIRQIFIAPIKEGISDDLLNKRIQEQLKLKDYVSGIDNIFVSKSLGLYGVENALVMTIDLKDEDSWNQLLNNDYHTKLGNEAGNYFVENGFIAAQMEI